MNKIITLFLITILLFSCTKNEINDDIVLKIGKLEITAYEMQKQLQSDFSGNKNKKSLKNFKSKIINKYLFVTDARKKGYDKDSTLQKQISGSSDYMMVCQEGYLWKHRVTPVINEYIKITPEKIKKRSKLYYFDLIECENKENLLELLNNDTSISYKKYNELKNLQKATSYIQSSHLSIQWPFSIFREFSDYLYTMKKGQVSELLTNENLCFYFYLSKIEDITVTDQNKKELQIDLTNIKEYEVNNELDKVMIAKGNPVINPKAIKAILTYMELGNEFQSYKSTDTILSYTLNNKRKHISASQFIERQNFAPVYIVLNSEKNFISALNNIYYADYLKNEALELGLYEDKKFLLDKKNYLNNVLYVKYIANEITNKILVDSSEVLQYYSQNLNKFSDSKYITVDSYFFNTKIDADNAWIGLNQFYRTNPSSAKIDIENIINLKYSSTDDIIDKEDLSAYKQEDLYKIINLQNGHVSYSIQVDDMYVLYVQTGQEKLYTKKLVDVYTDVETMIMEEKTNNALQTKADELRNQYPIEIDKVDFNKL